MYVLKKTSVNKQTNQATNLCLVQGHHGDAQAGRPQVVALSQGPDEQQVSPRTQHGGQVAQGAPQGRHVWAHALQAEAGHQAVGALWRERAGRQGTRAVYVDREHVAHHRTQTGRLFFGG